MMSSKGELQSNTIAVFKKEENLNTEADTHTKGRQEGGMGQILLTTFRRTNSGKT